jgi:RNA polymerase sigma factor (sigma-70 family)
VTGNSGTAEEAKDVFQDGLIVLFNNIRKDGFELTASLKTYMYSICRNIWLMRLRAARRETPIEDRHEKISFDEDVFQTLVVDERRQFVLGLLDRLGDECRRILEMFYYRQLTMEKIREAFGLGSEQAAKNKKSLCLKKLRDRALSSPEFKLLKYER